MASWHTFQKISLRDSILVWGLANMLFALLDDQVFSLPENSGTILLAFLLALLPIFGWGTLIVAIARTKVWDFLTKLGLAGSFIFFLVSNGLIVFLYPSIRHWVAALFTLVVIASLGWSVLFALIARKFHWSPRTCWAVPSVMFFAAGSIQFMFESRPSVLVLGMAIGYICRKLVYPDLPWLHVDKPEPPTTLFTAHSS